MPDAWKLDLVDGVGPQTGRLGRGGKRSVVGSWGEGIVGEGGRRGSGGKGRIGSGAFGEAKKGRIVVFVRMGARHGLRVCVLRQRREPLTGSGVMKVVRMVVMMVVRMVVTGDGLVGTLVLAFDLGSSGDEQVDIQGILRIVHRGVGAAPITSSMWTEHGWQVAARVRCKRVGGRDIGRTNFGRGRRLRHGTWGGHHHRG